ncbi:MAG: class I SAM-dependent methyltransferase [Clostridiales bacterium]|nr:class I SAM-dependent methyltransferase [Clostridiales bacterium]
MSERLDIIISLIEPAPIIADVGCDHAKVAAYCAENGIAQKVIASDISEKCLQKARARLSGVSNAEFVCCDGIAYSCDEAVIAGMGGLLISEILKSAVSLPKTVIVSPHRDEDSVRRTLLELGYGITDDIPVMERGKYYSVIRARIGAKREEASELQILFGMNVAQSSDALREKLKKLYVAYAHAPTRNSERLKYVTAAMRLQGIDPNVTNN